MNFNNLWIQFSVLLITLPNIQGQLTRTILDDKFGILLSPIRKLSLQLLGSTGVSPEFRRLNSQARKLQSHIPKSTPFPCDTKTTRSKDRPISVHKLRPGDIDIIGAMGDSLTAATAAMAISNIQILNENRGISWSIGGQEDWRTVLTLPNILKEFNPNLYGYSVTDSFSTDRISKFNTAEPGAMSRDMPHQARNLIKRMTGDSKVNMTSDWKLVTILIGANDFCADMCYYSNPDKVVIRNHERDLIQTLRILKDNIPRLMVNIVPAPNLKILTKFTHKPKQCYYTHLFECPCLFGWRSKYVDFHTRIMKAWQQKDEEVAYRDEFNTEEFTVNLQPFSVELEFPKTADNKTDFSFMAPDCFHLSQKAHASSANALWNNMLEPMGQKSRNWHPEFDVINCPTKKRPYIATRENSKRR